MQSKAWNKKTILIVEDDEISAEFLKELLLPSKVKMLFAEDGETAVNLCLENPNIDIVLMDVQLPVMSGQLAMEKIKKHNENIIIIAQTAFAMSGDREKYLQAGFNNYIAKPIHPVEMLSMLEEYLDI